MQLLLLAEATLIVHFRSQFRPLSSATLTHTETKCAALCGCFRALSPNVFHLVLISWPPTHPSLSITLCDCTQHTAHAPELNTLSVGVQRLNSSFNLLGKSCRCAKGYNNRNLCCNHHHLETIANLSLQ